MLFTKEWFMFVALSRKSEYLGSLSGELVGDMRLSGSSVPLKINIGGQWLSRKEQQLDDTFPILLSSS